MTPTAAEQAVFDHWVTAMGKTGRAIFADERIKPVRERLAAGFTIDDLKQAIDGCAKSTFHMGVNDQHRPYNDLELICRDAKHVESFLGTTQGKLVMPKTRDRRGPLPSAPIESFAHIPKFGSISSNPFKIEAIRMREERAARAALTAKEASVG